MHTVWRRNVVNSLNFNNINLLNWYYVINKVTYYCGHLWYNWKRSKIGRNISEIGAMENDRKICRKITEISFTELHLELSLQYSTQFLQVWLLFVGIEIRGKVESWVFHEILNSPLESTHFLQIWPFFVGNGLSLKIGVLSFSWNFRKLAP